MNYLIHHDRWVTIKPRSQHDFAIRRRRSARARRRRSVRVLVEDRGIFVLPEILQQRNPLNIVTTLFAIPATAGHPPHEPNVTHERAERAPEQKSSREKPKRRYGVQRFRNIRLLGRVCIANVCVIAHPRRCKVLLRRRYRILSLDISFRPFVLYLRIVDDHFLKLLRPRRFSTYCLVIDILVCQIRLQVVRELVAGPGISAKQIVRYTFENKKSHYNLYTVFKSGNACETLCITFFLSNSYIYKNI